MRFSLRIALVIVLGLTQFACAVRSNLAEGISSFRVQNYRQAFVHLKPEAKKGQPDAQYAVGYMYYYGQGVVENRKRAWYWINKAARAGQPDAVAALAILHHQPESIATG
ncbi:MULTISPECIES: tetratricopeptide repeat protein [unclassified Legionella]|uniref:tetratricopeptide repeat protein n=1 Tax=unclassified Legionella TaxID=2622702 RepID=UPI001056134E|nr:MULTISPECIES: SEL1-like repeat protein [unclassified Legionella]MDI9819465.1 SEL1-like repeat protein [Legionella sp. PL877]